MNYWRLNYYMPVHYSRRILGNQYKIAMRRYHHLGHTKETISDHQQRKVWSITLYNLVEQNFSAARLFNKWHIIKPRKLGTSAQSKGSKLRMNVKFQNRAIQNMSWLMSMWSSKTGPSGIWTFYILWKNWPVWLVSFIESSK